MVARFRVQVWCLGMFEGSMFGLGGRSPGLESSRFEFFKVLDVRSSEFLCLLQHYIHDECSQVHDLLDFWAEPK